MVNIGLAGVAEHLKSSFILKKNSPIRSIDAIYLINLDHRPEKLEKSLQELKPYGIVPYRFSAVEGAKLTLESINQIGVSFTPKMRHSEWVRFFPEGAANAPEYDFLSEKMYGKTIFSKTMTKGTIGCTLSHLSILEQAYQAGFETIWIMEDDILVKRDPHLLDSLIQKLDHTLGKKGWDILYTDTDRTFQGSIDHESDLPNNIDFFRPDLSMDPASLTKRSILSKDFVKIGCRIQTHSMIIRRLGMKKILDFAKKRNIFLPYDLEIAFVPNIKLVNLREDFITADHSISDTNTNSDIWGACKKEALHVINQISGWRENEKAEKLMDFTASTKPQLCVEIGAFGGTKTYPIARALKYLHSGQLYAIDAWDFDIAIQGLTDEKKTSFWKEIDFDGIYTMLQNVLVQTETDRYCHLVRKTSKQAVSQFENNSIDFLFIDGSETPSGSLEDVTLYFPKVKEGGYIWLNKAEMQSKNEATAFLMKNCTWVKDESIGIDCIVFQK